MTSFMIFFKVFSKYLNLKVFSKFEIPNPALGDWRILSPSFTEQIFVVFEIYLYLKFLKIINAVVGYCKITLKS